MTFMACYSNFSQGVLRNAFTATKAKKSRGKDRTYILKSTETTESQSLLPEKTMKSSTKNFFLFSKPTSELMQS